MSAADTANTVARGIVSIGVSAAKTAIIAEVPFLGLPVINTIFNAAINYVAGFIADALATSAVFTVIDVQTGAELGAFQGATTDLQNSIQKGDPDEIEKSRAAFKASLGRLIHFDI